MLLRILIANLNELLILPDPNCNWQHLTIWCIILMIWPYWWEAPLTSLLSAILSRSPLWPLWPGFQLKYCKQITDYCQLSDICLFVLWVLCTPPPTPFLSIGDHVFCTPITSIVPNQKFSNPVSFFHRLFKRLIVVTAIPVTRVSMVRGWIW